jgi:hypothetical protein
VEHQPEHHSIRLCWNANSLHVYVPWYVHVYVPVPLIIVVVSMDWTAQQLIFNYFFN